MASIEKATAGDAGDYKPTERQLESNTTSASVPGIDPELERRVVRKIDKRVPTLLAALYLVSFLDRSNIGNAKIAGMEEALNLVGGRYENLITLFYISYIVFEFQAFMWKIVPPHIWGAFIVFAWGAIATAQAAVQSYEAELGLRFVLGIFEAGFGPGVPYLLSFFYLRHELGSRIGLFLSCAPLANTFAGALAYGITSGHSELANWRLLFLVEGIPTLIMAVVTFFFLPDSPATARFLNEEEKVVAEARGVRQVGEVERVHGFKGVNVKEIGATLMDPKAWFTALMYFSCNVSFASLPVFLPTILEEMGFSSVNAQGLTAPPYFISFLVTCGSSILADRIQQRGFVVMTLAGIGGLGYVLLTACKSVAGRYIGVFLAASGVFPAIANILPWVLNNQGSDTRRATGIVLLNVVGQCGPILGTRIFPDSEAPRFIKGQAICTAFMFFTVFLAFGLRTLLKYENRKLDRLYAEETARAGSVDEKAASQADIAQENYGPSFRYVL